MSAIDEIMLVAAELALAEIDLNKNQGSRRARACLRKSAELRDLTTALGKVDGMNAGLAKRLTTDLERAYTSAAAKAISRL